MIKDNQKYFNRLQVLLDAVIVAVSYVLAWYLKFRVFVDDIEVNLVTQVYDIANSSFRLLVDLNTTIGALSMRQYFNMLYFIVPGYVILYYMFHLYTSKRDTRTWYEVSSIIMSNVVGIGCFMVVQYLLKQMHFSREMLLIFVIANIVLMVLSRSTIHHILRTLRKKGYNLKHMILVGYSRAAEEYINRIMANPQWGYVVCGILDDRVPRGTTYKGVKVLGEIDNLLIILPENRMDEIAITLSLADYDRLEQLVDWCEKSGVHTKFIPDYNSLIPSKPYTEDILGLPVINIRYVPLTNTINWWIKRFTDFFGALFALIVASPVMIVAAIAIKCTSKGPIIFKQERIGLHNKPFKMYKFRSMVQQTDEEEKKGWTVKDDPRVTKVGAFLRKTSLDELPQLFNILKGDMSLVGPRPERPQYVEQFKEQIPRYMIKHQVRPGLTGWAQVNGYRGDTSIRKRVEYDIYYIENWTFGLDVKILFLTLFTGFVNKNAY